ncbi:class V lanthionine synthetase subunit LxmK [Streptomyces sp. NPDC045431]|uniref:class V lanthionine synthetase subunit LxmK n=1 Tax=Streptomyces sp. NPDC045431 TaxID=3155613 RepID=UPI0033EED86B
MVKTIGTRERPSRFQPVDLLSVPHVDALLIRLGLGPLDPETTTSPRGRNDNWAGTTAKGMHVFVKRFSGGFRQERLSRTRTVWERGQGRLPMPVLIGSDPEHALMVFEYLPNGETGTELAADGLFDEELSSQAGSLVAALHSLDPTGFDTSAHPLPPVGLLRALPFARYVEASGAELAMWRLLHNDAEVVRALEALRDEDAAGAGTRLPIHGDMRLDQFLRAGGTLHLTDFEESRIADPARDIGAFAGEWLFQATSDIPKRLAEASPLGHIPGHEEIVATGAAEIEQQAPLVRAFFRSYLKHAPESVVADEGLAVRAAAYAGWHMLDRMLASSESAAILSPVVKAAAGIGRTVLLAPAEFTSSLGLEG